MKKNSFLMVSGLIIGVIAISTTAVYSSGSKYFQGRSNQENCIRNYGGTWACIESKEHRDLFADILKNGGCLVEVPDMGEMMKTASECKAIKRGITIKYLPNGESIILKPRNDRMGSEPMSDAEYRSELAEFQAKYR